MQHPNSRRLALVADRPQSERDLDEGRQAALEFPADALPSTMRLTIGQILQVAEDADIRAHILSDVESAFNAGPRGILRRGGATPVQIDRRVDGLHEVADNLRNLAAQTIDRWLKDERPT